MMKKRVVALIALLMSGLGVAPLALAGGSLDGKTFTGVVGQKGKTEGQADDLVFQGNQFESTLCRNFGYGKGAYTTTAKGNAVAFNAETTSAAGGKMKWEGTVKGNAIEGKVLSAEKGATSEMWFKGTLKKS